MGIRFYVFILMLTLSVSLLGQGKINFAELDRNTFDLYEKESWKELRELGNLGLESGTDYFYLRMRLGIAEYELNRYEKASRHFKKALKFNANDPVALEYLYYSLIFAGRQQEARLIASDMPEATRKKIGLVGDIGLTSIFIEGGKVAAANPDSLVAYKPLGPYVHHLLLKDFSYAAGGAGFNMGRRVSLTAAINLMNFNVLQEGTIKDPRLPMAQYFEWEWQNSQTGFFLGSEITLNPNWYLGLSGHFINGDFNYMWPTGNQAMGQDLFREYRTSYRDNVINAELNGRFTNLHARLIGSYSDLGNVERFQPGLMINWYPFGNLNLYLQAQTDRIIPLDKGFSQSSVFQALIGTKIFSKLWLEAHGAIGDMAGWTEKSGYLVYNNQDPILKRAGLNLLFPYLVSNLSLSFRFQYQEREHSWYLYNGDEVESIEKDKYFSTSLIGGLSWNF